MAGLLAWFATEHLPIPFKEQWYEVSAYELSDKRDLSTTHQPYSYGDSAGFSPDFPFNPPTGGTKSAQK